MLYKDVEKRKAYMEKYIDLHTHTTQSDGDYTPETLIEMAIKEQIGVLAITDHNTLLPNYDELQKRYVKDIVLVSGSEISATHLFTTGKQIEIHIVGLFLEGEDIKGFLSTNRSDGKQRAIAILERLKKDCGIDLGHIEKIQSRFPNGQISRTGIAKLLVERGVAESVKEAFDIFVGDYGEKRAFVQNKHKYAGISEVIAAVRNAEGVAVLAHPLSYGLNEAEMNELLQVFVRAKGQGMEVFYGSYTEEERSLLLSLAMKYDLVPSCGSDFHRFDNASLCHHFSYEFYEKLRSRRTR